MISTNARSGRRPLVVAALATLGILMLLTLGAGSALAFRLVGTAKPHVTPMHAGHVVTFSTPSLLENNGNFDRLEMVVVSGGPLDNPSFTGSFPGGWVETNSALHSTIAGSAIASATFTLNFQSIPTTVQVGAYLGSTLIDFGEVSWDGSNLTINPVTPTYPVNGVFGEFPTACVTTPACFDIPIDILRSDVQQIQGYSVTFSLSPGLTLCGVTEGAYLAGAGGTTFLVTGTGPYTVDCALLVPGASCGPAASSVGNLFKVSVKGVTDGLQFLTMTDFKARNCLNVPFTTFLGSPVPVYVDIGGTAAVTGLGAVALGAGMGNVAPVQQIKVTWTGGAGATTLERMNPIGAYPEYSDDGAAGAWALVGTNLTSGYVDVTARGIWIYRATVVDECGVSSTTVTMPVAAGVRNYQLGDVSPGGGDNTVDLADITRLGAHYGLVGEAAVDPFGDLDVGPTDNSLPSGTPLPDDKISFEDLVIFSINYGANVQKPQLVSMPAAERNRLTVEAPENVTSGQIFTASLRVAGAGNIQALSAQLGYDHSVVEPMSVKAGSFLESQNGVVFSAGPGNVDAALLGVRNQALSGTGELATVTFRAIGAGNPSIGLARLDARDAKNAPVEIESSGARSAAAVTALSAASPNPFKGASTLAFSLAKSGAMDLSIYSVDGRKVKTLYSGTRNAGAYRVIWDGRDESGLSVHAGVFYARLTTGSGTFNRSITYLK